jgi:hypothetical protein
MASLASRIAETAISASSLFSAVLIRPFFSRDFLVVGLSISAATTAAFFVGLFGRCDLTKSTCRFLAILVGKVV